MTWGLETFQIAELHEVEKPSTVIVSGIDICSGNGTAQHIINRHLTSTPLQSWCQNSQRWKLRKTYWFEPEVTAPPWKHTRCDSSPLLELVTEKHSVQQAEGVCAPVSHTPVLPTLPQGLDMCSRNKCEMNKCRQQIWTHLAYWDSYRSFPWRRKLKSEKTARISLL